MSRRLTRSGSPSLRNIDLIRRDCDFIIYRCGMG